MTTFTSFPNAVMDPEIAFRMKVTTTAPSVLPLFITMNPFGFNEQTIVYKNTMNIVRTTN